MVLIMIMNAIKLKNIVEGMGVGFWFGVGLMEAGLLGIAWCGINATVED